MLWIFIVINSSPAGFLSSSCGLRRGFVIAVLVCDCYGDAKYDDVLYSG